MMLVRDDPAAAFLAQAYGESEAVRGIPLQLISGSAAEQGPGEGDVVACRDIELDNLERRTLSLPLEERGPGLAVRVDAPHAVVRWRHVEHDDVIGMVGQDGLEVSGVDRPGPALDERPDLGGVVSRGLLPRVAGRGSRA